MNKIFVSFIDGPKVEIVGDTPSSYHVQFIDNESGWLVYETRIGTNNWCMANLRYYVPWRVKVFEDGALIMDHLLDLKGRNVLIQLGSKSLGDTIAWMPYAKEFKDKHGCEVTVATHWNEIFDYSDLRFISAGTEQPADYTAIYRINAFDNDTDRNKNNWRLIPLQQVATDFLGLEFKEQRASIKLGAGDKPIEKYVCISEFTTFHGKQWNHPGGWQTLCDTLKDRGYAVRSVSKEPTHLHGIDKQNGKPITETIRNLQHCEMVITVATGLAWLGWAMGKKVVIISGMTPPYMEMSDCIRVINPNACNSCYGDLRHPMDRGNWRWCPRNKNFECTTAITPQMVLDAIDGQKQTHADKEKTLDEIALHHGTDKASWGHNYTQIYPSVLEPLRDKPITMLEIGVFGGASIRTWLEYFPKAQIYGIDLASSWKFEHPRFHYRIGDQRDTEFLKGVSTEAGLFDVIIDDGSHAADAIRASFQTLWPFVKAGGYYIVEDCYDLFGMHFDHGLTIIRKHLVEHPRFSLIMPTKDRPEMIQRAVSAIMAQDYIDWELIVKDAGESIEHLLPKDPRIKYEHCPDTDLSGWPPARRFNKGLAEAKGEIFNFCADDDVMLPGTLRCVHSCIGDSQWFYGRIRRSDTGALQGQPFNQELLKSVNIVPAPAAFWTRQAMNAVGKWDDTLICCDWDYWRKLADRWTPGYTDRVLVDYTVHPDAETCVKADQMRLDVAKLTDRKRILFIAPHCSTGGMPQYLLWYINRIKDCDVAVVEWNFLGEAYVVQRNQIKSMCPLYSMPDVGKLAALQDIIETFKPHTIHLQEFPEMFMAQEAIQWLYRDNRNYELIETGHSSRLAIASKVTKPDRFVFVSRYHANQFQEFRHQVPWVITEYECHPRTRPNREKALENLGLDPAIKHVLNVGLFTPQKNQAEAMAVAALLPNAKFHFVGNYAPNFSGYWQPLLSRLPSNCLVWGERDDVDAFYSAMDAFLFTSLDELNPLVLKEAVAWGMPVFAKNLVAYCGAYDGKVTYIGGDPKETAAMLKTFLYAPQVTA